MNTLEQTTRKWEVGDDCGDGTAVVTCECRDICRMEMYYADGLANARRIVAAVNACKGISTEALEGGIVEELREACKSLLRYADAQSALSDHAHAAWVRGRDAIAKAKGE